jgi:hypothetical protein
MRDGMDGRGRKGKGKELRGNGCRRFSGFERYIYIVLRWVGDLLTLSSNIPIICFYAIPSSPKLLSIANQAIPITFDDPRHPKSLSLNDLQCKY